MDNKMLNIRELSDYLDLSLSKCYALVHQAGFPAVQIGRRILVPYVALQEWITDNYLN